MKNLMLVSTIAAILGLGACSQQDSAVEAQRDVEQARQQAAEDLAKAQQEASAQSAEAAKKLDAARDEARAEVAKADTEANEKINSATGEAHGCRRRQRAAMSPRSRPIRSTHRPRPTTILPWPRRMPISRSPSKRARRWTSGKVAACKDQANAAHDIAKQNAKRALDDAQAAAKDAKR